MYQEPTETILQIDVPHCGENSIFHLLMMKIINEPEWVNGDIRENYDIIQFNVTPLNGVDIAYIVRSTSLLLQEYFGKKKFDFVMKIVL
jgi:hypothetical protein